MSWKPTEGLLRADSIVHGLEDDALSCEIDLQSIHQYAMLRHRMVEVISKAIDQALADGAERDALDSVVGNGHASDEHPDYLTRPLLDEARDGDVLRHEGGGARVRLSPAEGNRIREFAADTGIDPQEMTVAAAMLKLEQSNEALQEAEEPIKKKRGRPKGSKGKKAKAAKAAKVKAEPDVQAAKDFPIVEVAVEAPAEEAAP